VKGVNQSNDVYAALAGIMLLACIAFGVTWAACMVVGVMDTVRQRRMRKLLIRASKAQQQATMGGRGVEGGADDSEQGTGPLDHVANVSHRGSETLDPFGVRDVLTPIPASALAFSNPMQQRMRRLLGAGVPMAAHCGPAAPSECETRGVPQAGAVAAAEDFGRDSGQHLTRSGGSGSPPGPSRVRMSTAAVVARRLGGDSGSGAPRMAGTLGYALAPQAASGSARSASTPTVDRGKAPDNLKGSGGRAARAAAMVGQRAPR
jgi:hypothetical protein